LHTKRV